MTSSTMEDPGGSHRGAERQLPCIAAIEAANDGRRTALPGGQQLAAGTFLEAVEHLARVRAEREAWHA